MFQNNLQRDPKKQRTKYSGKKKLHTEKTLVVYSTDLKQILAIATAPGSIHDFKLFKQSKIWSYKLIQEATTTELDLGFLGVKKYLPNAQLPHKRSKLHPLTKNLRQEIKLLSQSRIKIENINREIKIFKICAYTRRHKQKKHNLFWNLIAGLVNFKLRN